MIESLRERLEALRRKVERDLAATSLPAEVEEIRVRTLGKKGALTAEAKAIGALPAEDRPQAGELVNAVKNALEAAIAARETILAEGALARRLEDETLDVTLPGRRRGQGTRHPLSIVTDDLLEVFRRMGFSVASGPEVETPWHNFEALNIPAGHPAREEMDTIYLAGMDRLLRTHTSPVQIRTMETRKPPVRIICPGRVYRRDADITHSPVFHQVEGLAVDRGISMSDLKGTLELFARELFGPDSRIRFRPSFFPFTEPSAEVDVLCFLCKGDGCRVCKASGWLEILGSGMVHPRILRTMGYDTEDVTGWAFGMGVERVAMLRYGIDDIRLFYENDLRFLSQF